MLHNNITFFITTNPNDLIINGSIHFMGYIFKQKAYVQPRIFFLRVTKSCFNEKKLLFLFIVFITIIIIICFLCIIMNYTCFITIDVKNSFYTQNVKINI